MISSSRYTHRLIHALKRANPSVCHHLYFDHLTHPLSIKILIRPSISIQYLPFSTSHNNWDTMFEHLSSQPLKSIQTKNASLRDSIIATTNDKKIISIIKSTIDPTLKRWINNQRYYYKKQNLNDEKIKLLEKLNFIWDVRECMWNIRLNELYEFKEMYGHTIVPRTYEYYPKLPAWVHDIRNRRRYAENEKQSTIASLTEKQMSDLNKLEFVWEVNDSMWYERFYELKKFHDKFGHTQVTKSNYDDMSLIFWVNHQRQRCKAEEKINLLDSLGFVWNVPQSRSERGVKKS